jgi:ABC-2 type transport system ATP-binding protein
VISVSRLTRKYGAFVALDDVSFEIGRGEVVGVLGPNGAGKTTLLRILAGFLPATSGSASLDGFDVLTQSLEVRRRIGYLPENVPLYREHRVAEMLEFQGRLHGLSRGERRRRIPLVLERVGLSDRSRDLIGNLSRGLRQRAGLAVALLPEPEVLILDEPTSGLDPLQRIEVRGVVRELAERHTILLSSHILPEVEAVCPRVIILHKGRIAADGTSDKLVSAGDSSHVRLEAVVGADVEKALRLLGSIPGVRDVVDRGRRGIHHEIDIHCDSDLREEVGAVAAQRGWALRELSWRRPTLEEIFARIALSLDGEDRAPVASERAPRAEPSTTIAAVASAPIEISGASTAARAHAAAEPAVAAQKRVVYNLNPFDMGASRDLGKPKVVEAPSVVKLEAAPSSEPSSSPVSHAPTSHNAPAGSSAPVDAPRSSSASCDATRTNSASVDTPRSSSSPDGRGSDERPSDKAG